MPPSVLSTIKDQIIFPDSSSNRVRWLKPSDEKKFQSLLRSIYEGSYAYKNLYKKGGYTELLESGNVLSLGEFSPEGILVGHSAFIMKDLKQDYIESGFSFRTPKIHAGFISRLQQKQLWQAVLQGMGCYFNFIYQQTSTYHILAQAYALKNLAASFCGLIVEYTQNEKLTYTTSLESSMQALMLVTCLPGSQVHQEVYLPEGPWGDWFKLIYDQLNLPRSYNLFSIKNPTAKDQSSLSYNPSFSLELINYNPSLKLSRFKWAQTPTGKFTKNTNLLPALDENYLIHVPMDNLLSISFAWATLLSHSYVPVGIRPYTKRPDEMVFQYLGARKNSVSTFLKKTHLINNWQGLVELWHTLTLQIL